MEPLLTTLILIIAPDCWSEGTPLTLEENLNYNNTGYERFVSPHYEVVCMGGVDILSIESVTVPLLRQVFPDNPIIFVYGKQQEWDYRLYIANKYGMHYYSLGVEGNADVSRGYAIAPFSHAAIQHERAHIETCAAHMGDSSIHDPLTWSRTMDRLWCPDTRLGKISENTVQFQ